MLRGPLAKLQHEPALVSEDTIRIQIKTLTFLYSSNLSGLTLTI